MGYNVYIFLGYGAFFGILGGFLFISFLSLHHMRKESQKFFKK